MPKENLGKMVPKNLNPAFIAIIDIGTHSVHLVVARINSQNKIEILASQKEKLQLGKLLDEQNLFSKETMDRVLEVIQNMKKVCLSYSAQIRAVATYAFRKAKNSPLLVEKIYSQTGIKIEIIDGLEEAYYTYLGICYSLPSAEQRICLAVDIGGGSSEVILASEGQISHSISLDLGAVVLSHQHFAQRIPTLREVENLKAEISHQIKSIPAKMKNLKYELAIASSGTAKTLATVNQIQSNFSLGNKVYNPAFTSKDLAQVVEQLSQLRCPKKIRDHFLLSKKRAEVLLAGALILQEISLLFEVENWTISSSNLREGLIMDSYQKRE